MSRRCPNCLEDFEADVFCQGCTDAISAKELERVHEGYEYLCLGDARLQERVAVLEGRLRYMRAAAERALAFIEGSMGINLQVATSADVVGAKYALERGLQHSGLT